MEHRSSNPARRHFGLRPLLGTGSSPAEAEFARGYGYRQVFSYTGFAEGVLAATAGRGVDVVLDPVGGQVRARSFELLAPFGRLVTYSNISREPEVVPDATWMRPLRGIPEIFRWPAAAA